LALIILFPSCSRGCGFDARELDHSEHGRALVVEQCVRQSATVRTGVKARSGHLRIHIAENT
jgi:hypothetical protein